MCFPSGKPGKSPHPAAHGPWWNSLFYNNSPVISVKIRKLFSMKSYRDNGLEQMSGTKLNAGPRHFILSGKTRKRKITKKKPIKPPFSQLVDCGC